MVIGRCPGCDRPYTAGEVAGLGILRPRSALAGGPWVDFACPGCDRTILLVPHGQGRYAPPGEPAPPPLPPEARTPPWVGSRGKPPSTPPPSRERPAAPPPPAKAPPPPPAPPPTPRPEGEDLTVADAIEILGISPTADRQAIDAAYRERSLQCHPDKVAHLDPDFRALAERKFRRLRAAYEMLTE